MDDYGTIYQSEYNMPNYLYQSALIAQGLKEPYENLFVMAGPRVIRLSTHDKNGVNISVNHLLRTLQTSHVPIDSVTSIIHNHPKGETWWSGSDWDAMKELQKAGFQGQYKIFAKDRFLTVGE